MRFDLATMAKRAGRRRSTALPAITPTKAQADALAVIYMRIVRRWSEACRGPILAAYTASLEEAARMRDGLTRDDAFSTGGAVDGAGEGLLRLLIDLVPELEAWVLMVEKWHRGRWTAASLTASGVDLTTLLGAGDVRESLDQVLARNVALMRDLSEQARGRIADIVLRGLQERRPAREVAKQMSEAVGLSRKRALGIASDQLSKLSARLDEERQAQAGIEQFRWRHSGKLHPRENHKARDGKLFDWNDPPADGKPGTLPYCGCKAQAYLDLGGD